MKTPMQEMLEWVRATLPMDLDTSIMIEQKIESMLEKEKEVIINAYNHAYKKGWDYISWQPEQYYNQTFKTNQENLQDSTNGYTYYPQENKTVFNTIIASLLVAIPLWIISLELKELNSKTSKEKQKPITNNHTALLCTQCGSSKDIKFSTYDFFPYCEKHRPIVDEDKVIKTEPKTITQK